MTNSRAKLDGPLALTLAQAWHAFTGYLIFVAVARALGRETYGDFTVVLWAMTTTEAFMTDGVPKAVSFYTARHPASARSLLHLGLRQVTLCAVLLGGAFALTMPWIAERLWKDPELVTPGRISALDLLAFVGFAVVIQVVNGLHRFGRQAAIWFTYSTLKMITVLGVLAWSRDLSTVIGAYVVASLLGSITAVLLGRTTSIQGREPAPCQARDLWRFGLPISFQALLILALVNLDLWVAKAAPGSTAATHGIYGATATLARALFFIFRAFGDALFPAVARALSSGDAAGASRSARKAISLLLCLLLPAVGLATGSAQTVLPVLFGDESYGMGGDLMRFLAPAAGAWTLTAVSTSLLSASGAGKQALLALAICALGSGIAIHWSAQISGPMGAAQAAAGAALGSALLLGGLAAQRLGRVWSLSAVLGAVGGGLILDQALHWWRPDSALVFVYGGLCYAVIVGFLWISGAIPRRAKA